jgi:hypothetical protein
VVKRACFRGGAGWYQSRIPGNTGWLPTGSRLLASGEAEALASPRLRPGHRPLRKSRSSRPARSLALQSRSLARRSLTIYVDEVAGGCGQQPAQAAVKRVTPAMTASFCVCWILPSAFSGTSRWRLGYAATPGARGATIRSSKAEPASSARRTGHVSATRVSLRCCSGVRSMGRSRSMAKRRGALSAS